MGRFCYCSKVLPGKSSVIKNHWNRKEKSSLTSEEIAFRKHLTLTGFESFLQQTDEGDFMIHCLEGESLSRIFTALKEKIVAKNKVALELRDFYLEVLGKDYLYENEPKLEELCTHSFGISEDFVKRAFFYPLLAEKEEEHRKFRKEVMGEKKERHEASMRSFGVFHLSTWLQTTTVGKSIIVYTERHKGTPSTPKERLKQGENSIEWQEIASILMSHTGLKKEALSPDIDWLTKA